MNPHLLLILIALCYIVIVGGLAALRREGFSLQFALEVALITGLLVILSLLTGRAPHPVFSLILIYLVTMRARLLVDLGTMLARSGRARQAMGVYDLALKLKPDGPSRQVVLLNQAVYHLQQSQLPLAIAMLEHLVNEPQNQPGPKYEAAARYNLAVAYQRQGNDARAVVEFNKAIDAMPGSLYASRAQMALTKSKRQKETADSPAESQDEPKD